MKLLSVRNTIATRALILVQCFVIGLLGCNEAYTPDKTVQDYQNAFNSHNVDSLMSLYSDDVVFFIPDLRMNFSGKTDLRGIAEYDSVLNTTMILSDLSVAGDTVFCSIKETNEWMEVAGISSAFYPDARFVVFEGKVTRIEADISDTTLTNFKDVMGSFMPWARQFHTAKLDSLMPGGVFQFSAASGILYLELLKEWKRTSHNRQN